MQNTAATINTAIKHAIIYQMGQKLKLVLHNFKKFMRCGYDYAEITKEYVTHDYNECKKNVTHIWPINHTYNFI